MSELIRLDGRENRKLTQTIWKSRKGIAIPVTFLVMFVSLTLLVATTYYFAVNRINAESITLKVSVAKRSMFSLEDSIASIVWAPGSFQIFHFSNREGTLM
ncbi:MAG: hypothetical protein JSW53_02980, partial [Candidatus Bathyarchaeota archaeon]